MRLTILVATLILTHHAFGAHIEPEISPEQVQTGEEISAIPENITKLKNYDSAWEQSMSDLGKTVQSAKEIRIEISKSRQRMTVYLDGALKLETKVSTGMRGHTTPSGKWKAGAAERGHFSREFGVVLPWAVQLGHTGYFIHAASAGAMYYIQKGIPHSHGCIRTPPENAKLIYELVKKTGIAHTEIVVR